MKTKTTILLWLYVAFALVVLFLVCRVACAPVKAFSAAHCGQGVLIAGFIISLAVQFIQWINKTVHQNKTRI